MYKQGDVDLSYINEKNPRVLKILFIPSFIVLIAIIGIVAYWTFFDNAEVNESNVWEQVLGEHADNSPSSIVIEDPFEGWETWIYDQVSIRYPPELQLQEKKHSFVCQFGTESEAVGGTVEDVSEPFLMQICHFNNNNGLSLVNFALHEQTWLPGKQFEVTRTNLVRSWNTANLDRQFEAFVFEGTLQSGQELRRIIFFKLRTKQTVYALELFPAFHQGKSTFSVDVDELFAKILTSIKDKNDRVVVK